MIFYIIIAHNMLKTDPYNGSVCDTVSFSVWFDDGLVISTAIVVFLPLECISYLQSGIVYITQITILWE